MAYIDQDEKKAIAANLKKVIPNNWKYSLAVRDHSAIVLTIASAPVDLLAMAKKNRQHSQNATHLDLNTHYLDSEFKGHSDMVELFGKILKTLRGAEYFDHSDSQTDYFHLKHYVYIKLGKWNKGFIVTGADGKPLVTKND